MVGVAVPRVNAPPLSALIKPENTPHQMRDHKGMGWRFNPPPGWPQPSPGWQPPPGWAPDPAWPPAPQGWVFWVPDESATYQQHSMYTAPQPAEAPRRSRPLPWILGGAAALAALCCGIFALSSISGDDNDSTGGVGGGDVATQEPQQQEDPGPGIGDPARDGKFEFAVQKAECGAAEVGSGGLSETAQGQFCLVTISVKNIGDEARTMSDSNQEGIGSNGAKYSTNSVAGLYANADNALWLEEINPGNQVSGVLVYDVPKDVRLVALELHDSAFSGGVKVSLE